MNLIKRSNSDRNMSTKFKPIGTVMDPAKTNPDETVYKSYPRPKSYGEGCGDRDLTESSTEDIIAALQKLHKKFQQLEHDKEAAELSFRRLASECNEIKKYLNAGNMETRNSVLLTEKANYIQSARDDCQAIEKGMADILNDVRDAREFMRPEPIARLPGPSSSSSDGSHERSAAITITKVRQPFGYMRPSNTVEVDRVRGVKLKTVIGEPIFAGPGRPAVDEKPTTTKHLRFNLQQVLPFVPSKVAGPSHSLPANIQTLIASLKRHNPWLCTMVATSDVTVDMIQKTKKDLNDVISSLEYGIECLTVECEELGRTMASVQESKKLSNLQQRRQELCHHRDELVKHIQKICKLQNQLQIILKHFEGNSIDQKVPVTAASKAKIPKMADATVKVHTKRRTSPTTRQHPSQLNYKLARSQVKTGRKVEWNNPSTHTATNEATSNLHTYRYIQLLQYALKRNGLKLNTRPDKP